MKAKLFSAVISVVTSEPPRKPERGELPNVKGAGGAKTNRRCRTSG